MARKDTVPRVSGGMPWWVWGMGAVFSLLVVFVILLGQNKISAEDALRRCIAAAERGDRDLLQTTLDDLKTYEGIDDRIEIVDGMLATMTNRQPRAIRLLTPHLEHADTRMRDMAQKYAAVAHRQLGNAQEAHQLLTQIANENPDDVPSQLALLDLLSYSGSQSSTAKLAKQILEIDPENQVAQETLATCYLETGQKEEAVQLLAGLLDTDGKRAAINPDLISHYLKSLLSLGRNAEALEFVDSYTSVVADNRVKFDVYLGSNEVEKIMQLLKELKIDEPTPMSPLAQIMKARQLVKSGDALQALDFLESPIALLSRYELPYVYLEQAADALNNAPLAEAARKNREGIRRLESEMESAVQAIGDDISNAELRIAVADLAEQRMQFDEFRRWLKAAAGVQGINHEIEQRFDSPVRNPPPLVPVAEVILQARQAAAKETSEGGEAADETSGEAESPSAKTEESAAPDTKEAAAASSSGDEPETAEQPSEEDSPPAAEADTDEPSPESPGSEE